MGAFRLGRTGAGFFRLHRGSGRHAVRPDHRAGSGDTVLAPVPVLGYAPTPPPEIPLAGHARPPAPTPPAAVAAVAVAPPGSGVALVFEDGSGMMLDAADPRVRVFRAIAGQLTAR